jgi:beta-mannanase
MLISCPILAQTADKSANNKTVCVYNYLAKRATASSQNHVMGQELDWAISPSASYSELFTAFQSTYGTEISLAGINYYKYTNSGYPTNFVNMNAPLIKHSNKNGMISIMADIRNPWTMASINDTAGVCSRFYEVYTNGNSANTNFNRILDSIAIGFQQLQDSNVTILFRPFHEMNAAYLGPTGQCNKWWAQKHPGQFSACNSPNFSEYQQLWIYTFNYLHVTKKLHNIRWVYSPSALVSSVLPNSNFKTEDYFYPGNNYVDIVGVDIYDDTLAVNGYNELLATGKPFAICEFGPKRINNTNNQFTYDYGIFLNQMKKKYPATCYWMSWSDFPTSGGYYNCSLVKQNGINNLLADSSVSTLNELPNPWCMPTSINENASVSEKAFVIFPNPTSGVLNFSEPLQYIEVLDVYGQLLLKKNEKTSEILVGNYKDGIYFIKSNKGLTKFIINH